MAKHIPRLDEKDYPKVPLRLKAIPLENGEGQPLRQCKECAGEGEICHASRVVETPSGSKSTETIRIQKAQVKKHRLGWSVTSETCRVCSGAGMMKCEVSHV